MNRFQITAILLLGISCNSDKRLPQDAIASIEINVPGYTSTKTTFNGPFFPAEPYQLTLKMLKLENDMYDFIVGMQLYNGSYYVSPNAKRDFKGKFTILIDDTEEFQLISDLIETPLSVEEFDPHPFVNGNVNWVRENTTYNQKIQRRSDTDFQVMGKIQFTIEPRCTLEQIPIIIKFKDGEMRAEIFQC